MSVPVIRQCPHPKCQAYGGGHTPECPLAPPEYKAEQLLRFVRICHEYRQTLRCYRTEIALWQGKFAVLKHENNALRRRLRAKEAPCTTVSEPEASASGSSSD